MQPVFAIAIIEQNQEIQLFFHLRKGLFSPFGGRIAFCLQSGPPSLREVSRRRRDGRSKTALFSFLQQELRKNNFCTKRGCAMRAPTGTVARCTAAFFRHVVGGAHCAPVIEIYAKSRICSARFYNSVTLYMCFLCYDKGEGAKMVWRIFCLSKTTLPFGGS